jgi:hypothetical protein
MNNLTSLTAPNVKELGDYAFAQSGITSFNLPEVTKIGHYAFYLTGVTTITQDTGGVIGATEARFPSLRTADNWSFRYMKSLSTVDLPLVTRAGGDVFTDDTSLETVRLDAVEWLSSLFVNCTSLKSVYAPLAMAIMDRSFERCAALETLTLGATPPAFSFSGVTANSVFDQVGTPGNPHPLTIKVAGAMSDTKAQTAYAQWITDAAASAVPGPDPAPVKWQEGYIDLTVVVE